MRLENKNMRVILFVLLIITQSFSQLLDMNDNSKLDYRNSYKRMNNNSDVDYKLYDKEVFDKTGKTIRQLINQSKNDSSFQASSFTGKVFEAVQTSFADFCKSQNDCYNIQKYLFNLLKINQSALYIGIIPNVDDYPEFLEIQGGGAEYIIDLKNKKIVFKRIGK